MNDFTFLTEEQIFGSNQLDILRRYGTKCAITDFAILLGGYVSSSFYTSEGNTLKDRTGWWWTKSPDGSNDARFVDKDGTRNYDYVNLRYGGARPALPYSSIQSTCSNEVISASEVKKVEWERFPQTIVNEIYSCKLERAYNNGSVGFTGRFYPTDSVSYQDINTSFIPRIHLEYEYKGSKYIRFIGDSNGEGEVLSDGRTIKSGQVYWVQVEPIIWLVDEIADIALAEKILFSGVQFNNLSNYQGDFDRTDIKQFMDNCFSKEIVTDRVYSQTISVEECLDILLAIKSNLKDSSSIHYADQLIQKLIIFDRFFQKNNVEENNVEYKRERRL